MLKNKIIVRKIRNIFILLMAIVIMIGAYKNIGDSRAEDVIEIDAIAIDNYGYLSNELFKLEATQIDDDNYQIELPDSVNGKEINEIVKVTLEEPVLEDAEVPTDTEVPTEQETEAQEPETPTEEKTSQEEQANTIEIIDNKITLTKEQIESKQLNIETKYHVTAIKIDENGEKVRETLAEKTEEELEQLEITEETEMLYSKILRYEDEENGKLVEVKGNLPEKTELMVTEVLEEHLKLVFGDKQIDVAYDIKLIMDIKKEVLIDENNPELGTTEITETIQINPEDYEETCEVTIKDTKIQEESEVYHVKEDNTYETVNVKENEQETITFDATTFSVYAISADITPEPGEDQEMLGAYWTSREVKNVTKDGYDVYVYGVPSSVTRVRFPTWTNVGGQDDITWDIGTKNGTTWSYRVNVATRPEGHRNIEGWYHTHIYFYNSSDAVLGNTTAPDTYVDRTAPTSSNISMYGDTKNGFTILISGVTDNYAGVIDSGPEFTVWTKKHPNNKKVYTNPIKIGNGEWKLEIPVSDFSNDEGWYYTHVYIVDKQKNKTSTPKTKDTFIDRTSPTLTVTPTYCNWRNTAQSVTINAVDVLSSESMSGLREADSEHKPYQYFLSNKSDSLSGGTWTDYTSGTAFNINPGTSGEYWMFIKKITDKHRKCKRNNSRMYGCNDKWDDISKDWCI